MLLGSMIAITLGVLVQRRVNKRRGAAGSAVEQFAQFEI
jgi:hypothetical protein